MLNMYLYISTLTVFKAVSKLLKNYDIHIGATWFWIKAFWLDSIDTVEYCTGS